MGSSHGTDGALAPRWGPGSLSGPDRIAESIAAKDLTNLYRTSCYFRDEERYRAFCGMYAVMRVVDDHVDDLAALPRVTSAERAQARAVVSAWHRVVRSCLAGGPPSARDRAECSHPYAESLARAFADACGRFAVPARLWDDFFGAMLRDLDGTRFRTYRQFLAYAEGAAVAPTTVYLHLVSAEPRGHGGPFDVPQDFDIFRCGRALGRFAYLTHVMRDLREDLLTGKHGLLYLADTDMAKHGVTVESLRREADVRRTGPRTRALVRLLATRATRLARAGRRYLAALDGRLSEDRAFVLELIVRIYEAVLGKIAARSYDVMAEHHRLTSGEKERIARDVSAAREGSVFWPLSRRRT